MASLQSSLNHIFLQAMGLSEVLSIQSSAIVEMIEVTPIAILQIKTAVNFSKHKDSKLVQLASDTFYLG